jgi:hypothetical protein|nr:MAG TPA: hypothetical protein [Caudoviricetes sp.]
MNKLSILSQTPVLRALIYAIVGIVGVIGIVTGAIDVDGLNSWVDRVPSIAATAASVLALANIRPTPKAAAVGDADGGGKHSVTDPTAAYAARLREMHGKLGDS